MSDVLQRRNIQVTLKPSLVSQLEQLKELYPDETDSSLLREAFRVAFPAMIRHSPSSVDPNIILPSPPLLIPPDAALSALANAEEGADFVQVDILGQVAAGKPLEELEEREMISVPRVMLKKTGMHFALRVCGDSMIEEGINDGDIVIVREQKEVINGEKAVVWIRGDGVTLKKYYLKGDMVVLLSRNEKYEPMTYPAKQVVVKGLYVATIKTS